MVPKRGKVIHSVGFVSKIKIKGLSKKYTGAFQEESYGFIRPGFIAKPNYESEKVIRIGIGLKVLRSKVLSANLVSFDKPTGQKEFDFFHTHMKNHVASPMDIKLKIGAFKFMQATWCINQVGLREFSM